MNKQVEHLIGWWKLKGEMETDPFIKFMIFYICFDAWITAESGEDKDYNKFKWFKNNDNCLKTKWNEIETKSLLMGLASMSPIDDMRPNKTRQVKLKDTGNIGEVINFIYQIRCNLFHGSKSPMNTMDSSLVDLSGKILEKWIVWSYLKCVMKK